MEKKRKLFRCNNAYQPRCPDRWRKHGCTARVPHEKTEACSSTYPCTCDGGFTCRCVAYVRNTPKGS